MTILKFKHPGLLAINVFLTLICNLRAEVAVLGPAPYWGYLNCGTAYSQNVSRIEPYAIAIGQTFRTPAIEAGLKLKLKSFSVTAFGTPQSYGQVRFRLWAWDLSQEFPTIKYFEYITAGDTTLAQTPMNPDIYIGNSGSWMHNNQQHSGTSYYEWLFKDWDFGNIRLESNTVYYWEIELLKSTYNNMDYLKLGWGASESGVASGNWIEGAAYQRFSDGAISQILPEYGECDTNFKFEFEVVPPYASNCGQIYENELGLIGDLNEDCSVDTADAAIFMDSWLEQSTE